MNRQVKEFDQANEYMEDSSYIQFTDKVLFCFYKIHYFTFS